MAGFIERETGVMGAPASFCACSFAPAGADCTPCGDYLHWLGGVGMPSVAHDVAVEGSHAYVADAQYGLRVLDILDPAQPRLVGSADTPFNAIGVAVSGACALVADLDSGLLVFPAQCPASGVGEADPVVPGMRLRSCPNPASRQALIRFETRAPGEVFARVHDLAGRAVPASIYLLRLSAPEGRRTARLLIIR